MSKWVEKGREKKKERRKHVAMQTASLMSPESMDQITPSAHAPYSRGRRTTEQVFYIAYH